MTPPRQDFTLSRPANREPAALTLDSRGIVHDFNRAGEVLFGYRRQDVIQRHVSMLLPQLTGPELKQCSEPNSRLRFLCRIGQRFRALTRDGTVFASELFVNLLDGSGQGRLSLIVRPVSHDHSRRGN